MKELFSLGSLYVSDFIKEDTTAELYDLTLVLQEDGNVKLKNSVPLDTMFGRYWYRSGVTNTMRDELQNVVQEILKVYKKDPELWIDIACNDGTLLSNVPKTITTIGIDPADNSFLIESSKHADLIIQDYFTADAFKKSKFGHKRADVITTIAMFYDLVDPDAFIKDVCEVLSDDGLWVIQLSYTPLMIKQLAFDNICHEHVYYYSLFNIMDVMERNGMKIVDCQFNDINGGSMRLFMQKEKYDSSNFGTQPYRDVCDYRIASALKYEESQNLADPLTWQNFYSDVLNLKQKTVDFIRDEKNKGKTIWGYGASTKGNTLLQFFGLDNTLLDGIAERSTYKYGLKTIGSNIPIYSEEEMRAAKPDYLLILPWHFISEFTKREKTYLDSGGKFIVPCPEFKIISAGGA